MNHSSVIERLLRNFLFTQKRPLRHLVQKYLPKNFCHIEICCTFTLGILWDLKFYTKFQMNQKNNL